MNVIRKVNSLQLYYLWRNFAISLLSLAATIALTHMMPFYMAPVISLIACAVLYTMIWNEENQEQPGCMIVMQMMLFSLLSYTFLNIIIVVFSILNLLQVPKELCFLNAPFMPSLTLLPISFIWAIITYFSKDKMPVCRGCIAKLGLKQDRGYYGFLTSQESKLQLKNLIVFFAVLSIVIWLYYEYAYVNINQNGRDWYVFVWLIIILTMFDELYFIMRYSNLYLDFKENDEIITPEEINDMTARTYLRFYLICGEYVFIDPDSHDRVSNVDGVYDTPFTTLKHVNGIPNSEIRTIVENMTGEKEGELKFYYGRHLNNNKKVSVLRYFYFLDGEISQYPNIPHAGKWVPFNVVQRIYQENPASMSTNGLADLSRLFAIMFTEKDFHENGMRKNPIRSYQHLLSLKEVRNTNINLQDDKWIYVSKFNSDTRFFRLKKMIRNFTGKNNQQPSQN